jgi:2-oxoglutarate ferredoxin oxidoreductase subunit beta
MSVIPEKIDIKDLKSSDPRWCTGCGDYMILVGLRKFMVKHQILREDTVNVSGIGCSGRLPHYMNTYGIHSIHGRSVPVALGVKLARPDFKVFVHSGDGDSLSIGGNHLMHGISKNFNCVYLMFDNQIYGLTKNQTSPTTRQGLPTQSQPTGSLMEPINPIKYALGLNASFVASTAEWLGAHFMDTLEKAFEHKGFSFVHVAQRCPKFNPSAWEFQTSSWLSFLTGENGVSADLKGAPDATVMQHDTSNFVQAMERAESVPNTFGIFYQKSRTVYDEALHAASARADKKDPDQLLDAYLI